MTMPRITKSIPSRSGTPARQILACLAIALLISGYPAAPATAQVQKGAKIADSGPNGSNDLDPKPFEADGLGLKMHLPAGANVIAQRMDRQLVVSVNDDPTTPTWNLRIQPLESTEPNPTPASQIENLLSEFKSTGQKYRVVSNGPFMAGSLVGHLCFMEQMINESQTIVTGWLLFRTGDSTFVVFMVQTLPEHMPRVRPLLEASFATIQLRSIAEIASERSARLEDGRAFIQSVTPEKLKTLVGLKHWYRIYKPDAKSGPSEIGYSLLEVLDSPKGALEPEKNPKDYDSGERTQGLMIRIQSRVAIQPERGVYYDSIALYWMAWDQTQELWNIRGTQWQGMEGRTEAESGVRTPYSPGGIPPRLTVIKSNNLTNARDPAEWDVPEVYLSQPLGWLIGRLLPRDVSSDREYRYYSYANASSQVSLRSDVWGPLKDSSGNFRLVTKLTSDTPPITSIYTRQGELVRRTHADGSITEPSTVENIHKLWKSQGLQVGKSAK